MIEARVRREVHRKDADHRAKTSRSILPSLSSALLRFSPEERSYVLVQKGFHAISRIYPWFNGTLRKTGHGLLPAGRRRQWSRQRRTPVQFDPDPRCREIAVEADRFDSVSTTEVAWLLNRAAPASHDECCPGRTVVKPKPCGRDRIDEWLVPRRSSRSIGRRYLTLLSRLLGGRIRGV